MCNIFPEFITIFFPSISYQQKTKFVMIRYKIFVRPIPEFHPAKMFATFPQRAICVVKKRKTSASLLAKISFVIYCISFKKPVGNGCIICQRLTFITKKIMHKFGHSHIKIIVLLNMAVFMNRKLVGPGKASQFKTIL